MFPARSAGHPWKGVVLAKPNYKFEKRQKEMAKKKKKEAKLKRKQEKKQDGLGFDDEPDDGSDEENEDPA